MQQKLIHEHSGVGNIEAITVRNTPSLAVNCRVDLIRVQLPFLTQWAALLHPLTNALAMECMATGN